MSDRPREDAVKVPNHGRYLVPTTNDTVWIDNWEDFRRVDGVMCFSEDQSEIELQLPVGHKFSIRFQRN